MKIAKDVNVLRGTPVSCWTALMFLGGIVPASHASPQESLVAVVSVKDVETQDPREEQAAKRKQDEISRVTVILAKHVLIYDVNGGRKRIGKWDDIFRLMQETPGRIHFTVRTTHGTNGDKMRRRQVGEAQEKYFELNRILGSKKFSGMSMGGVGRVTSVRFDQVRSAKDLRPSPELKISGQIVDANHSPIAGVDVAIVYGPAVRKRSRNHVWPFDFYLKGGKLRNHSNDLVSVTDEDGQFVHYRPKEGNYSLLFLHPKGFRHLPSSEFKPGKAIQLAEWAQVEVKLPGKASKYFVQASLNCTLKTPNGWPPIKVYYYDTIATSDTLYEFDYVAPGNINVSKSIDLENGGMSFPAEQFELQAGQKRIVEISGLTESQMASVERSEQFDRIQMQLLRGQPAPKFDVKDHQGKRLRLNDLKGQVVFLNIWSSKRAVSFSNFAILKELQKKYSNQRFSIVSFSLNENKKEWEAFLASNDYPWRHVWLNKQQKKDLEPYTFLGTSKNFLIDPQGNIFERNLKGNEIDPFLTQLFSQESKE